MLYKRAQSPGDGNILSPLGQNGRYAASLKGEDPGLAGAEGSGEKQ